MLIQDCSWSPSESSHNALHSQQAGEHGEVFESLSCVENIVYRLQHRMSRSGDLVVYAGIMQSVVLTLSTDQHLRSKGNLFTNLSEMQIVVRFGIDHLKGITTR